MLTLHKGSNLGGRQDILTFLDLRPPIPSRRWDYVQLLTMPQHGGDTKRCPEYPFKAALNPPYHGISLEEKQDVEQAISNIQNETHDIVSLVQEVRSFVCFKICKRR